MTRLAPSPRWRERLQAAAQRPPAQPRVPLWSGAERIGSVEPGFLRRAAIPASLATPQADGWRIQGELTDSLADIALRLRERGMAGVWRDEQLAVRNAAGEVLGTVERAAVRVLGITTHAVHLVAIDTAGRHWVQQRAFDKASDPGLWDTTVGGMVPASDSLQRALERETWEEAGLRPAQLRSLRHGGRSFTQRPMRELPDGYLVEHIDWYACTLEEGTVPRNQDGEVAAFRQMDGSELTEWLERDQFIIDAALVLLAAFGDTVRP